MDKDVVKWGMKILKKVVTSLLILFALLAIAGSIIYKQQTKLRPFAVFEDKNSQQYCLCYGNFGDLAVSLSQQTQEPIALQRDYYEDFRIEDIYWTSEADIIVKTSCGIRFEISLDKKVIIVEYGSGHFQGMTPYSELSENIPQYFPYKIVAD